LDQQEVTMSYQNVERLRDAIAGDEALLHRLDERDMEKFNQILIGIGQEKGIPISLDDIHEYERHAPPPLTEQQLQAVSGGAYTRPIVKASDGTSYSYGSDWRCGICGSTSGTFGTGL
jgi:hypothetical protein